MKKSLMGSESKSSIVRLLAVAVATASLVFSGVIPAQAALAVTSVSPTSGSTGGTTVVTITGTDFDTAKTFAGDAAYVKFGTTNATTYTVNSATSITATAPAGSVGVVAVHVGAESLASAYTYVAPTITSLSPATGPLGGTNKVVITGTNFVGVTGAASVKFGSNNATSYVVDSPTQITAVAPAGSAGSVNVVVVAGLGQTANGAATAYSYALSAPTITGISPTRGSTAGATSVVITGTNFYGVSGASAVKFGANNATSYVVNSPTQITAVAPAGVIGTVRIQVTAVDGTATLTPGYSYVSPSSATSIQETIYFAPGSSAIRSSEYAAIKEIVTAALGKSNVQISVTSRRWTSQPLSLGKARNTAAVKILQLVGFETGVSYSRFNVKGKTGSPSGDKNNRVVIRVTWTN